jgi:hypothetical protein
MQLVLHALGGSLSPWVRRLTFSHGDGYERCDDLFSRCISLWALAFLPKVGLL